MIFAFSYQKNLSANRPPVLDKNTRMTFQRIPIGTPVLFILNGHEAMSVDPKSWCQFSMDYPGLVVFFAVAMPFSDVRDAPKGIWSDPPFTSSPNRVYVFRRLQHILRLWEVVEEDATCKYMLAMWEKIYREQTNGPRQNRNRT